MERNLRLYPWYQGARNLLFWQGVWFLYFEQVLTAEQAISLAAIYEIANVVLEVPSGYFSDRIGRRITLIISAIANVVGCTLFFFADHANGFAMLLGGQIMLAIAIAFNSGTDSALLYDSLKASARDDDIAEAEAKAWRYSYLALAISAATGGLMASGWMGDSYALTYIATAVAACASVAITLQFKEPPYTEDQVAKAPVQQFATVLGRLRDPVLAWMCVFFGGLYILSHIPFVFVQPYLREMLTAKELVAETPIIIGLVIAVMMAVSAALASIVIPLRTRVGTKSMFMIALALQTVIIAAMAWIIHPVIVALLILRMVPGTLTRPFLLEAIQPRLESSYRATYLSVQSLAARLTFSATLFAAAYAVTGSDTLDRAGLAQVLPWCALGGLVLTLVLWRAWPQELKDNALHVQAESSDI